MAQNAQRILRFLFCAAKVLLFFELCKKSDFFALIAAKRCRKEKKCVSLQAEMEW